MYRIVCIWILCSVFLSCKSSVSETKDALYKHKDGKYYYAWTVGSSVCIGVCERKPSSVQEAIVEGVCTKKVRISSYAPLILDLPLGLNSVIDIDANIVFLYEDSIERSDINSVCLSEYVINRAKSGEGATIRLINADELWYGGSNKSSARSFDIHIYGLVSCSSCDPSQGRKDGEDDETYKKRCLLKDQDIACFYHDFGNRAFAAVKEVKIGLSFDEAKKYCKTPGSNKYVKDWNKVNLGYAEVKGSKVATYPEKTVWMDRPDIEVNAQIARQFFQISEDSKSVYTICLTSIDNLDGVYIFK